MRHRPDGEIETTHDGRRARRGRGFPTGRSRRAGRPPRSGRAPRRAAVRSSFPERMNATENRPCPRRRLPGPRP